MKKTDERGSTTIEALLALSILAIAGAALVSGSRTGILSAIGAQRVASSSVTVLRLDDTLRRAALRVRIPYWDRSAKIAAADQSLLIPWYDGDPLLNLKIDAGNDALVLVAGEQTTSFRDIRGVKMDLVVDAGGAAKGIDLEYEIEGRTLRILAPFGAFPLPKETP